VTAADGVLPEMGQRRCMSGEVAGEYRA